jgi:hypothetical protein
MRFFHARFATDSWAERGQVEFVTPRITDFVNRRSAIVFPYFIVRSVRLSTRGCISGSVVVSLAWLLIAYGVTVFAFFVLSLGNLVTA